MIRWLCVACLLLGTWQQAKATRMIPTEKNFENPPPRYKIGVSLGLFDGYPDGDYGETPKRVMPETSSSFGWRQSLSLIRDQEIAYEEDTFDYRSVVFTLYNATRNLDESYPGGDLTVDVIEYGVEAVYRVSFAVTPKKIRLGLGGGLRYAVESYTRIKASGTNKTYKINAPQKHSLTLQGYAYWPYLDAYGVDLGGIEAVFTPATMNADYEAEVGVRYVLF